MVAELMEHQEHILELLMDNDSYAILAEQGTGKTLPMLKHIAMLCRFGLAEPDKCLVVAPLSALGSWESDINLLLPVERDALNGIQFINYEKISRSKKVREELYKEWDIVVLDEAHAICNATSNRTKFFCGYKGRGKQGYIKGINELSKRRYILTGTLISNGKLENLYSPLHFLKPHIFGNWEEFKGRYLKTFRPKMSYYDVITGYKNEDELNDILFENSFRVLKRDCMDLPEKFPHTLIKVPLKHKAIYKQAQENYIDHSGIECVMDNPLVTLSKLRQLSSGFVYDNESILHNVDDTKMKYCGELIESILPNKLVIFYDFRQSCARLEEYLTENDINYITLNGDQKDKKIWRKFNEDDNIKVILVHYKSGNAGINLQSATHTIFFEVPQTTIELEQAEDRTHRKGVKAGCNYYFLLTEGSIEEKMYERLANKQDFTVDFYERTYYNVVV